jgi:ammonia channel protein AmtB
LWHRDDHRVGGRSGAAEVSRLRAAGGVPVGNHLSPVWSLELEWHCPDNAGGWLENLGFVDFAGSTVVHSVGAWFGLAVVLVVGARQGRFGGAGQSQPIQGANVPFSVLGALLLWFGWMGFNGGSTLALNEQVPGIVVNTMMAGVGGLLTAAILSTWQHKVVEVGQLINGSLAGLVAVTACCHVINVPLAVIVGGTGAAIALLASQQLVRWQIDDAVDAFPVHGAAGCLGNAVRRVVWSARSDWHGVESRASNYCAGLWALGSRPCVDLWVGLGSA